jgi:hypothetical protein
MLNRYNIRSKLDATSDGFRGIVLPHTFGAVPDEIAYPLESTWW